MVGRCGPPDGDAHGESLRETGGSERAVIPIGLCMLQRIHAKEAVALVREVVIIIVIIGIGRPAFFPFTFSLPLNGKCGDKIRSL